MVGAITNDRLVDASSSDTMAAFADALEVLGSAGVRIEQVDVPFYEQLSNAAFLALQAEAYAWHRSTLQTRWADYGRPTRLTLAQGSLISAGDLVQIERVRQVARTAVLRVLDERGIDLLLSPTTGYPAAPFSGASPEAISTRALHTPAWNTTGFPALSIPMGFDRDRMPLSLQIIGQPFADDVVLAAGHGFQQHTSWHLEQPPL